MNWDDLRTAFAKADTEARYPMLVVEWDDDVVRLGVTEELRIIEFYRSHNWETHADEWHGHSETAEEALNLAMDILSGNARTATEYRGDKMAGAWLEVFEGRDYFVQNRSLYLNPFDQEEWTSRRGERWRTTRSHRRYLDMVTSREKPIRWGDGLWLDLGQKHTFDSFSKRSILTPDEWMLTWNIDHYGSPRKGLKWVQDRHQRYIFQVPLGWRMEYDDAKYDWPGILYFSPNRREWVRVQTAFREPELAGIVDSSPRPPASVSQGIEEAESLGDDWLSRLWKLQFSNGEEDMLVYASYYGLNRKSVEGRIANAFAEALADSRFVALPSGPD